jgi:hypothetical protein
MICLFAAITVYAVKLREIKKGVAFVSPIASLKWTNHALIMADSTKTTCSEVEKSPHFIATNPALPMPSTVQTLFPAREEHGDFMDLFNFSGTTVIEYTKEGYDLNLAVMMIFFFTLSAIFQGFHGYLLTHEENAGMPRAIHYLEYSISSPLMVMVMAVNVGIKELFLVIGLGALFFAMNITGMLAEIMAHYAGYIATEHMHTYETACWAAHAAGWVIFFFAMGPVWAQYDQLIRCSENSGTPAYADAAVVVESLLFCLFGILQFFSLRGKLAYVKKEKMDNKDVEIPACMLFWYDTMHVALSLTAKVMLAWLLLGPAVSVDTNKL